MDTKKNRKTSDLKIKVATQNKSKKSHKSGSAEIELRSHSALLETTLDTSFNYIQVFKAVRDKQGKIIDFIWILNNRRLIEKEGDRVGKRLLQMNPGVLPSGLFDSFVQVTETGEPQTNEVYYNFEGHEDWFHQTITKLDDGFVLTGEIITERKKAEQEVLRLKDELAQKATDKYLTIFNSIDEGFHITEVIFDENNKPIDIIILEENPAACRILGGSFVGKRLKDLNPNYEEERLQAFAAVALFGESREMTAYSPIWKKWLEYHLTKVKDENNKVALAFRDVTERKQNEEALRKSKTKLARDLADTRLLQSLSSLLIHEDNKDKIYEQLLNAATAIMRSDMGSIQLFASEKNELFQLLTSGFDEQMVKQWEWIKMDSGTICCEAFEKNKRVVVPDIETCEFLKNTDLLNAYRLAGIRAAQSTPLFTRSGHIVGMISTHWRVVHEPSERQLHLLDILARQTADMVERKQTEEKYLTQLQTEVYERTIELKENKDLLQSIAEAIPDMINVQEYPSRKMIYYNRDPYIVNGFGVDELAKMTVEERHQLIHPDDIDGLKKYVANFGSLASDDIATVEYRSKNKLGNWVWLRARGKVFERDEKGDALSIVNSIQNVTDQKQSEEKIKELNNSLLSANKELSAANAELKNFNAVTTNNYTEALRHIYINLESVVTTDARNLSDTSKGSLRKAQASIQKMKLLTNDINNYLELYDIGIKKETIDPNMILRDVTGSLQKKIDEAKAKIKFDTLPSLHADPVLFSKLITHLIDNSIKFRKENVPPVITISSSMIANTSNSEPAAHNKPYIIIMVADNGSGLKNTEVIFELFTQLNDHGKHKGSGIGLAICKKIMEMHGGFIKAESEDGKETSIHCYFPSK